MSLPKPFYQDPFATIYHGDCRELMPLLPKVDLVLTDPPYGIGESSRKNATRGKPFGKANGKNTRGTAIPPIDYGEYSWDSKPASEVDISLAVSAGQNAVIWGGNYFGLPRQTKWLVWDKQNSGDFADCELAWTNLPGAVRIFRHMWNGMLRASERDVSRVHPTQKPVALMTWCLHFAPNASTILDPFMGSGTTLVAAKQLGRQAIGIDLEERYCEIAAKRLQQDYLPLSIPVVPKPAEQSLFPE